MSVWQSKGPRTHDLSHQGWSTWHDSHSKGSPDIFQSTLLLAEVFRTMVRACSLDEQPTRPGRQMRSPPESLGWGRKRVSGWCERMCLTQVSSPVWVTRLRMKVVGPKQLGGERMCFTY